MIQILKSAWKYVVGASAGIVVALLSVTFVIRVDVGDFSKNPHVNKVLESLQDKLVGLLGASQREEEAKNRATRLMLGEWTEGQTGVISRRDALRILIVLDKKSSVIHRRFNTTHDLYAFFHLTQEEAGKKYPWLRIHTNQDLSVQVPKKDAVGPPEAITEVKKARFSINEKTIETAKVVDTYVLLWGDWPIYRAKTPISLDHVHPHPDGPLIEIQRGLATGISIAGKEPIGWYPEIKMLTIGPGKTISLVTKVAAKEAVVVNGRLASALFDEIVSLTISSDNSLLAMIVGAKSGEETQYRVVVSRIQ